MAAKDHEVDDMIAQVTDTEIDEFLDQIDEKEKRFEKKKKKVRDSRHNLQKTAPSLYALLGIDEDTDKAIAAHFLSDEEETNKKNPTKSAAKKNDKILKSKKKENKAHVAFKDKKIKKIKKKKNDGINLSLLKKKAQIELTKLADANDQMLIEKERLQVKNDDLMRQMAELKESMSDIIKYKDEIERLKAIINKMTSDQNTLQTEVYVLREAVSELNQNENNNENDESVNFEMDKKMDAVKALVKEKNEILNEFENTKNEFEEVKNDFNAQKKELSQANEEKDRLQKELTQIQQELTEERRQNAQKINALNRQLNASKNELMEEYEKKEQQFIQTVEEQLKYIDELENENEEFQNSHHGRQQSMYLRGNTPAGTTMMSLLPYKSEMNIFENEKNLNDDVLYSEDDESISFDAEFDEEYDENYTPLPLPISPTSYTSTNDDNLYPDGNTLMISSHTSMYSPNPDEMNEYLEKIKLKIDTHYSQNPIVEKQEVEQKEVKKEKDNLLNIEMTLSVPTNKGPMEQVSIRKLGYFFDTNGKLLPLSMEENDKENNDINNEEIISLNIGETEYEHLKNAITIYMFDLLVKYYKFKPKQIGLAKNKKSRKSKKQKTISIDYMYKTLLFSANFNKASTIFIILPPFRGGAVYWDLCVDKGLAFGSMMPYIEHVMQLKNGKCGVLLYDSKGLDTNANPYSIFKIYDRFLSKRIKSKKIQKVIFISALNAGNLVSHLLDRRGNELKNVVTSCIFLGCDDPYMTKVDTAEIYAKCATNWVNSKLEIGQNETGTKSNGDKYIIPRKSAGMPQFCCVSAFPMVLEEIKKSLDV